MTTPWHGSATFARTPQDCADWSKPTGDTQHVIYVARDELTCLGCGETFTAGDYCQRCGARDGEDGPHRSRKDMPPAVRTTSYLWPGEYEVKS